MLHYVKCTLLKLASTKSVQCAVLVVGWLVGGFGVVWGVLGIWNSGQNVALATETVVRESTDPGLGILIVDVSGAVVTPGTYSLELGDRVAEALQAAGGLAAKADFAFVAEKLNLAEALEDGQKLFVPFKSQDAESNEKEKLESTPSPMASSGMNLNTASIQELETLPGIGAKRAADIVAGRPYSSVAELVDREIITQKMMDSLQELVSAN